VVFSVGEAESDGSVETPPREEPETAPDLLLSPVRSKFDMPGNLTARIDLYTRFKYYFLYSGNS
jgi:hypothetical protein